MEQKTENVPAKTIFDQKTLQIIQTLLENPKIAYNKTQLADNSGVSRDALYKRWDVLVDEEIIVDCSAPGESSFYQLNSESELVNLIGKTLTKLEVFTSETES